VNTSFYENVYLAVFLYFMFFAESHFEWANVHASNCRPCIDIPVESFIIVCTQNFRFTFVPIKGVMFSKRLLQVAMDTVHKVKIN